MTANPSAFMRARRVAAVVDAGVEEGESLLDSPPSKPVASGRASESMGGLMMFVDVLVSSAGDQSSWRLCAVQWRAQWKSAVKGWGYMYVVVERCGGYETR